MDPSKTSKLRFSLAELLYVFVLAAGFLAVVAYVGPANEMFWLVTIWISLMTLAVIVCLSRRRHVAATLWIVGFALIGTCVGMTVSLALLMTCGLFLCFTLFFSTSKPRSQRGTVYALATIIVVSYAAAATVSVPEVTRLRTLRDEYPVVSIADRLEYEKERPIGYESVTGKSEPWEPKGDRYARFYSRASALRKVHSANTERFIRAQGFGVGRMSFAHQVHGEVFLIPDPKPIPFSYAESRVRIRGEQRSVYRRDIWGGDDAKTEFDRNDLFHRLAAGDFLDPNNIGWVADFRQVAGFRPHAFQSQPPKPTFDGTSHELDSLSLVSLRRFSEPRAYDLEYLPRMDELASDNAPTRELSEFERSGLEQLTKGDHIVIAEDDSALLMLGALRATTDCLGCHEGSQQELLGAFSYRFVRLGDAIVNELSVATRP